MEKDLKLIDMHNHTIWSDGANTTLELIEDALSKNIKIIGITDHFNTSKCPSLKLGQLNFYITEIEALKHQYVNSIEVLKGIEINPIPHPSSLENLPFDEFNKLDYVLIEYLDFLSDRIKLLDLERYIKKIKCRVGLAHTDLLKLGRKHNNEGGLDYVLNFLQRNNMFWEINSNLAYESFDDIIYHNDKIEISILFEKIKEHNIAVTVGSDKHSKDDLELGRFIEANKIAYSINFKRH